MRRKAKLTKKEINFSPAQLGQETRKVFSMELFPNYRQLKMYLMDGDGDCGNVTHLKTHCVAWPVAAGLTSDLTVRRGERSRVIVQSSLITHLYISHKGEKHTITRTKY